MIVVLIALLIWLLFGWLIGLLDWITDWIIDLIIDWMIDENEDEDDDENEIHVQRNILCCLCTEQKMLFKYDICSKTTDQFRPDTVQSLDFE